MISSSVRRDSRLSASVKSNTGWSFMDGETLVATSAAGVGRDDRHREEEREAARRSTDPSTDMF